MAIPFSFVPVDSISVSVVQCLYHSYEVCDQSISNVFVLPHQRVLSVPFFPRILHSSHSLSMVSSVLPRTSIDKSLEFLDTTHCCFPHLTSIVGHNLDIRIENYENRISEMALSFQILLSILKALLALLILAFMSVQKKTAQEMTKDFNTYNSFKLENCQPSTVSGHHFVNLHLF